MHKLSTVLFINERPIGYAVTVENGRCDFTPTEHSHAEISAPHFTAFIKEGNWTFPDFRDAMLIEQIIAKWPLEILNDVVNIEASAAP
jgi:hypothetical protein